MSSRRLAPVCGGGPPRRGRGRGRAVAVPLLARRRRIRPPATVGALVARGRWRSRCCGRAPGRATSPSSPSRCGGSRWPTSCPTTIPRRSGAGSGSATRSSVDRLIGGGELPELRLQRAFASPAQPTGLDRFLSVVHWAWFIVPHAALLYILARDASASRARRARWPRHTTSVRRLLRRSRPRRRGGPPRTVRASRCGGSWSTSARGLGPGLETLYDSLSGNPWAAMPSLHFATSLMAAILLAETGPVAGAWAGATRDARLRARLPRRALRHRPDRRRRAGRRVRRGEPLAEPVVEAVNRALQRSSGSRPGAPGDASRPASLRGLARMECSDPSELGPKRRADRSSDEDDDEEPPFFSDPKRLAQTVVVVLVLIVGDLLPASRSSSASRTRLAQARRREPGLDRGRVRLLRRHVRHLHRAVPRRSSAATCCG